jgi:hypothetical protein
MASLFKQVLFYPSFNFGDVSVKFVVDVENYGNQVLYNEAHGWKEHEIQGHILHYQLIGNLDVLYLIFGPNVLIVILVVFDIYIYIICRDMQTQSAIGLWLLHLYYTTIKHPYLKIQK